MKVKAAEIARTLGISKATVSLALNDKPGVSAETKEAILRCKEELERCPPQTVRRASPASAAPEEEQSKFLKLIMFDRGFSIICDPVLKLWIDSLRIFDREAKKYGYAISITYVTTAPDDIQNVIDECNSPAVAGVILYATEMSEDDYKQFAAIQKPLVIYDNDLTNLHHSVVADNENITQQSACYLAGKGYRTLHYLAQNINIYNFVRRRIGYLAGIYIEKLKIPDCPIIEVGETIEDVEQFMKAWLQENPLPDAFLMENYRVSIGTVRAMRSLGIKVPDQVGLLGIDEVSSYMMGDMHLSYVQIDHTDRVPIAVDLLISEIEKSTSDTKLKIVSRSKIVEGESLR